MSSRVLPLGSCAIALSCFDDAVSIKRGHDYMQVVFFLLTGYSGPLVG